MKHCPQQDVVKVRVVAVIVVKFVLVVVEVIVMVGVDKIFLEKSKH